MTHKAVPLKWAARFFAVLVYLRVDKRGAFL